MPIKEDCLEFRSKWKSWHDFLFSDLANVSVSQVYNSFYFLGKYFEILLANTQNPVKSLEQIWKFCGVLFWLLISTSVDLDQRLG